MPLRVLAVRTMNESLSAGENALVHTERSVQPDSRDGIIIPEAIPSDVGNRHLTNVAIGIPRKGFSWSSRWRKRQSGKRL